MQVGHSGVLSLLQARQNDLGAECLVISNIFSVAFKPWFCKYDDDDLPPDFELFILLYCVNGMVNYPPLISYRTPYYCIVAPEG